MQSDSNHFTLEEEEQMYKDWIATNEKRFNEWVDSLEREVLYREQSGIPHVCGLW